MLFAPHIFANILEFAWLPEIHYLAGGWAIAMISFGALRVIASRHENEDVCWLTALIGLFEGITLTSYVFYIFITTSLTFLQIAFSTFFCNDFYDRLWYCIRIT